jgi:hypothetical protein
MGAIGPLGGGMKLKISWWQTGAQIGLLVFPVGIVDGKIKWPPGLPSFYCAELGLMVDLL